MKIKERVVSDNQVCLFLDPVVTGKKEKIFNFATKIRDNAASIDVIEMLINDKKVVERDIDADLYAKYGTQKITDIAIRAFMNNRVVIYVLSFVKSDTLIVSMKENEKEAKSLLEEVEKEINEK